MTDPLGQSQVLPYLKKLAEKNIKIHLVSFEKPAAFLQHREAIEKFVQSSNIIWHPLSYTKYPPIFSTIYDVWKMYKKAKDLASIHPIELVHCRSYIAALVGEKLKRKLKLKFIFDMRGFYADERVDGKIWNLKNPIYRLIYFFFKNKERDFIEQADYVVCLTYKAKEIIHSWSYAQKCLIEVIPCCADLERFDALKVDTHQKSDLQHKLGIASDDIVVSYLGSIGTWYMLSEMLDFFSVFLKKHPKAKFLFITGDSKSHILQEAIQKNIPEKCILIQKAAYSDVPLYASLSTFSLFFILPVFSKSASSPTKQGELMGLQIPIICNAGVGDTDYVVNTYHSGKLVTEFSTLEYQKVIDLLPQILALNKSEIRKGAEAFYSLEIGVERYYNVYQKLLK